MEKLYLRIALPIPLRRLFDYLPPQDVDLKQLIPGARIQVPFQSRKLIGFLVEVVQESAVPYKKLKRAIEVLDQQPIFPPDIYKLCQWAADYYHYSLGEILSSALPKLLRIRKEVNIKPSKHLIENNKAIKLELNAEQQTALTHICAAKDNFKVFLLDGVTGSGKTEVYLQVMADTLANHKQVLLLVPEISLTPQAVERLRARFNVPVFVLHSNLNDQERLQAWMAAKTGEANIVIGTRSAIFTSFNKLGLIIIDEEHDSSFKQQDRFRYHARDLAIIRAQLNQIPIVLGSATPSLESLLNAKRARYEYLVLSNRAGNAVLPQFQIVDLRQSQAEEGLSQILLQHMRHHLEQGNQVMLFLNRRGYAPVLYCTKCASIVDCKRCDAHMVYHQVPPKLQCHYCDVQQDIPKTCAKCNEASLQPVGLGTQRLEQKLKKYFPEVPLIRVDRDNTRRKNAMQDLFEQINSQKSAILLGTQMLAKGHHFSQVTLVGIIDADSGLFSADYRAAEQMGQLLLQVAGRAGREDKKGTVVIQTNHPEHPLLQTLIQCGYQHFSQILLKEREEGKLPPFTYFAVFRAQAYDKTVASAFLMKVKELCNEGNETLTILGPVPAFMARRKGLHSQHLVIKSNQRNVLQKFLKDILAKVEMVALNQPIKWTLDVDPVEV